MAERWYLALSDGEKDFRKKSRYPGTMDIPANSDGRLDTRRGKEQVLRQYSGVSVIFPLQQAEETAQILTSGSFHMVGNKAKGVESGPLMDRGRTNSDSH